MGRFLAALIVCLLASALNVVLFLASPWGASRLAGVVERIFGGQFEGDLLLGEVRLVGLGDLRIERVLLVDPEGAPAASLESLEVDIRLVSLLRHRLVIRELWLERPIVKITDRPTAGLPGVFIPRIPPAPAAGGGEGPPRAPIPIDLRSLQLSRAAFLLEEKEKPTVLVEGIWGWIRGGWEGRDAKIGLHIRGDPRLPVRAPLEVDLYATMSGWDLSLEGLSITLGETRISGTGVGDIDELMGDVRLFGRVSEKEARQVGVPLASGSAFSGRFHLAERSHADVSLSTAGGGALRLSLEASRFRELRGDATFSDLDPSKWIEGAPEGNLQGTVSFFGEPGRLLGFRLELGEGTPIGPGRIEGELRREELLLHFLLLDLEGGVLRGEGRLGRDRNDLQVRLDVDNLSRLMRSVGPITGGSLPPIAGKGIVRGRIQGTVEEPSLEFRLDFPSLRVGEVSAVGVLLEGWALPSVPRGRADGKIREVMVEGRAPMRMGDIRLSLELRPPMVLELEVIADELEGEREEEQVIARGTLSLGGSRLAGEAALAVSRLGALGLRMDIPSHLGDAPPTAPLSLDLWLDPLDLARLRELLDVSLPSSLLRLGLQAQGTVGDPLVKLTLFAEETILGPVSVDAHLHATLEGGTLSIEGEGWSDGRILELSGAAPLDASRALRDPRRALDGMLSSSDSRAMVRLRGIDLSILGPFIGYDELEGVASFSADLRGPIGDPRGTGSLEFFGGPFGPLERIRLSARAVSLEEEVRVDAEASVEGQPPIRLAMTADTSLKRLLSIPENADVSLYWEMEPFDLASLVVDEANLAGTVRSRGRLEGTLDSLRGEGSLELGELIVRGQGLGSYGLRLNLRPEMDLRLFGIDPEAGTMEAHLRVEETRPILALAKGRASALLDSRATASFRAHSFSLRPLALLPNLVLAEGDLFADVAGAGRLGSLTPVGDVSVEGGEVQLVDGIHYDRIGLRASLEEGRIDLALLEVHGGSGFAVMRGELLGTPSSFDFVANFRSRRLPLGGEQGVSAYVTTRGLVDGQVREGLTASIELESADVELPATAGRDLYDLSPPEDVVVFPPEEEGAGRVGRRGAFPIVVTLDVEDRVSVHGPDLFVSAEVGLEVRSDEAGELVATGGVVASEGRARLLGRDFTIEPSQVRWTSSPLENPHLDLTARYQGPAATAWVDVSGTLAAPVISLRSDPPLPEGEIALLIASGGTRAPGLTPMDGTGGAATPGGVGVAASLLGSVAGERLRQMLGPRLPIDVLSVEAAEGRTLVQAGTYLGTRLYVGFARNVLPEPGENANEVRVSYWLAESIAVQSSFGDAANGGVDLVWTEQFPTGAQRRARARSEEEERGADSEEE